MAQDDINQESSQDASKNSKDAFFDPKPKPKMIRILTVLAYVLSVSMAAIFLSIYYIFMWHGEPHLGAHRRIYVNHSAQERTTTGPRKFGHQTSHFLFPLPQPLMSASNATAEFYKSVDATNKYSSFPSNTTEFRFVDIENITTEADSDSSSSQDSASTDDNDPVLNFLGENPNMTKREGADLHNEIIIRWSSYLREGLTTENRKELTKKFPIPANCPALQPPKMNDEIKPVLPNQIQKNDYFFSNLQEQMGAALTALGQIINLKIVEPDTPITLDEGNLQKLTDAAQLIAATYQAISVKRRFEAQPFINEESRSAAQQSPIDEYLFGSGFMDKLRSYQTVRKASEEVRKAKKRFSSSAGSSHTQHLNSKRPQYKKKMKEGDQSPIKNQYSRKPANHFYRREHYRQMNHQYNRKFNNSRESRARK